MLNEDIYILIFNKLISREQQKFDQVKNWKTTAIIQECTGTFKLNDKWPETINAKEKLFLHSKVIYKGTHILLETFGYAKNYFNRWPIMSKFEKVQM